MTKLPIYNSAVHKDMKGKVADLLSHFSEMNIVDKTPLFIILYSVY